MTPIRTLPETLVALGWLESANQSVRLIAADCLSRAEAAWVLPELVDAHDGSHLLNRQFAHIGLERMLGASLGEIGYRFYQTVGERESPINQIRLRYLAPETTD